jgi:hypothetical protein
MPIVFVHGVNNRRDSEGRYQRAEDRRDEYFKNYVLRHLATDANKLVVLNPYWGDDAASFPWDHGALPEAKYEKFGREQGLEEDQIFLPQC